MSNLKNLIKKKFANNILFYCWSIRYRDDSRLLSRNRQYKNIHKGERCFILGNGPSLKTENLKVLGNEIVFTVNQFFRSDDAMFVKPNYHFWADDSFFCDDGSEASKELIDCMKKIYKCNKNIISFFPLKHKKFIKEHSIDKDMKVGYFYSPLLIEEHMREEIDYSKFSFNFGTVVQWCIAMAIYMGFSEIYLLGCDNTTIMTNFKSALNMNDSNDYGYNYSINEKVRMEKMVENKSIEAFLRSYLNNISQYRYLYQYCQKRNIRLINCSSTTLIDSIPRVSLNKIVS